MLYTDRSPFFKTAMMFVSLKSSRTGVLVSHCHSISTNSLILCPYPLCEKNLKGIGKCSENIHRLHYGIIIVSILFISVTIITRNIFLNLFTYYHNITAAVDSGFHHLVYKFELNTFFNLRCPCLGISPLVLLFVPLEKLKKK